MRYGILVALLIATGACAQQPVTDAAFETASIRPAKLTDGCFSMLPPGGTQYALTCVTLKNLIGIAYRSDQIEGGGPALQLLIAVLVEWVEVHGNGSHLKLCQIPGIFDIREMLIRIGIAAFSR